MDYNKRYVFDLDNTLCDTKKGEDGNWDYLGAKPFKKRIEIVNKLYENGNHIIIETARGCVSKKNWYEQTYNQLINFGLKFHELRTGIKYNADLFIDDKAHEANSFFSKTNQYDYKLIKHNNTNKITIFCEIFVEKNESRLDEYIFCIKKNIENNFVDKIFLVCHDELYKSNLEYFYNFIYVKLGNSPKINLIIENVKRFTFNNFVKYTENLLPKGEVVAVINLDIFLPEIIAWSNIKKELFQKTNNEVCLALARTEYINETIQFRDERAWDEGEFADCWVFQTPIKLEDEDFPFEIPVGSAPTCDNFMFLVLKKKYTKVFNWAQKYIIYHFDFVRKPEIAQTKSGKMILHNDVVNLDVSLLHSHNREEYILKPYQDWDKILKELIKNMERGALSDKFAHQEFTKLIEKYKINKIVETGTYLGWSTKILCDFGVIVDSVEIKEEFYNLAKQNLVYENLNLHLSNSIDFLKKMEINEGDNFLIFIDSHWEPLPLPLLDELEVIHKRKLKPVIIIHDFFVPDYYGNAKFGYDKYGDVSLNFDFIKNKLDKIYDNNYSYHYSEEIDCVDSGLIYIYPNI